MNLFRRNEVIVTPEEFTPTQAELSTDPIEPITHFRDKTRKVIERLQEQATNLRNEIDAKAKRLAQLERIIAAEGLALEHMED